MHGVQSYNAWPYCSYDDHEDDSINNIILYRHDGIYQFIVQRYENTIKLRMNARILNVIPQKYANQHAIWKLDLEMHARHIILYFGDMLLDRGDMQVHPQIECY